MNIRKAMTGDSLAIVDLLKQLNYDCSLESVTEKVDRLLQHADHELLVATEAEKVIAFLSVHFIPQLGLTGDTAVITYFAVDSQSRSNGVGRHLESFCTDLALKRGCSRIQVHCHSRRTLAHQFYERQGYTEFPKYYNKFL